MLFRSDRAWATATTEIYTTRHTLSLHDALPIFLFVTMNSDFWVKLAFPVALHGGTYWSWKGNEGLWRERMTTAGFDVVEVGTRPAEMYVLARKRALKARAD